MPATGRQISRDGGRGAGPVASPAEMASYIGDMAEELDRLAAGAGLDGLSELLRKAADEARRHLGE